MIKLDISKSDRYSAKKIPYKSASIRRGFTNNLERDKLCFFEDIDRDYEQFEKGFAVLDDLLPSHAQRNFLPVKMGLFVADRDWSLAKRKDGEILYFFDSDNVVADNQPLYDFSMSGTALMSYDVFGDNINSDIDFVAKDGTNKKVPMYVFTLPLPVGYYLCDSCLVIISSLFVNLSDEVTENRLLPNFSLLKAEGFCASKGNAFSNISDEFFYSGMYDEVTGNA